MKREMCEARTAEFGTAIRQSEEVRPKPTSPVSVRTAPRPAPFPNRRQFSIIAWLVNRVCPGSEFRVSTLRTRPGSSFSHGPHSLRSQSDRLSAHRRRPHGAVQLAVRPAAWRAVPAADRRHRRRAERRGGARADPARLSLAGHRLGRRPRSRRAARAVLPVAAAAALPGGGREAACRRASPIATIATPERLQAEREAAQAEKRPFLYSRRWMAETDGSTRASFEAEGRQAVVRLKMPREGKLDHRRPRPRRRRVRLGPRAGPRHPAGRRHLPVSPGQRGRRFRLSRSRT